MDTKQIIKKHGGCSALATKLGLENPDGCRRVYRWLERDKIPAEWILKHPRIFKGYLNCKGN